MSTFLVGLNDKRPIEVSNITLTKNKKKYKYFSLSDLGYHYLDKESNKQFFVEAENENSAAYQRDIKILELLKVELADWLKNAKNVVNIVNEKINKLTMKYTPGYYIFREEKTIIINFMKLSFVSKIAAIAKDNLSSMIHKEYSAELYSQFKIFVDEIRSKNNLICPINKKDSSIFEITYIDPNNTKIDIKRPSLYKFKVAMPENRLFEFTAGLWLSDSSVPGDYAIKFDAFYKFFPNVFNNIQNRSYRKIEEIECFVKKSNENNGLYSKEKTIFFYTDNSYEYLNMNSFEAYNTVNEFKKQAAVKIVLPLMEIYSTKEFMLNNFKLKNGILILPELEENAFLATTEYITEMVKKQLTEEEWNSLKLRMELQ